jgi:predicted amidophosphoribosyltransferase
MQSARKGFQNSPGTDSRVAVFADLDEQAILTIGRFLEYYARAVCISANRHLAGSFSKEVDFCVALDFNRSSPQASRTGIGEWEYRAKYRQAHEAIVELQKALCTGFRWLPWQIFPKPRLITYVPCESKKKIYLPRTLAEAVVDQAREAFWGASAPLLRAELKGSKESMKNLNVNQKIAYWAKLADAGDIMLSGAIKDRCITVIDDLYQSGASLWSFAKFLKAQGAAMVAGLVCVKSLRDTDNR